ncbi:uncharacterized protein SAPINGB_P001050 [Magnusiomyces paraingens]|uniref:Amino acid permease/ SLC12A domain-containing protein n=1 Tax=Magnusiomyces paraingens TaxID=2606893 RepID=A0A5E8B3R0_9ASCO|nr:uncharacterized protein SAPINGB_P001050 [Saprochaete ingens]VVT46108.1 unnamed protein product [Saprochaete ingens]
MFEILKRLTFSFKKASSFSSTDSEKGISPGKDIGVVSAVFLIFNRMVGTGIFATPSAIYSLSGSVGASLLMWVAGALIAASGLAVYLEWGTAIPKNGGEKNYLEYFYNRPKFLMVSMFSFYGLLLGWAASNSVVFGEYVLTAANVPVDRWNQRAIGVACITFCFLIHSCHVKTGLWIQNALGIFKLVVIAAIIITGAVGLAGGLPCPKTDNFVNAFAGEKPSGYGVVMALYNVIWSFIGYSNANYALGEARDPVRTLRIAAPLALIGVSILYLLVNVSYFAVVPKSDLVSSGRVLAASFFRHAFGPSAQRALAAFISLSALGNVMAVIFSQGRIVQELALDGILPFSRFFASKKPFNSPAAGLFSQWFVSVIIMVAPPPGDAYNFILNVISYPLAIINALVAFGLLVLSIRREKYNWFPPICSPVPVTIFFLISSLYLVVAPFIPPSVASQSVYEHLPYWLHCAVGIGFFVVGAIYWAIRFKVLTRIWPNKFPEVPISFRNEDIKIIVDNKLSDSDDSTVC